MEPAAFGRLKFKEAATIWLADHKKDIAEKTWLDYKYFLSPLTKFFGELQLSDIHVGHVQAFVLERRKSVGATCVNHEIVTLKQILARASLWDEIKKFYRPEKALESRIGRAMEPTDEQRLFEVAATNPRWMVAYWCSIITATTTAGPTELAHLHLNDIELGERPGAPFGVLRIRDGLKNGHRERSVPLNVASRWAAAQLVKRYHRICEKLGIAPDPEHFVLVGRGRSSTQDPWKPMRSWKKAWNALREAAGMPNLRMYDLRHHAITKLMEDPTVSEGTIEEIAGHALSSKMKKHYSHIRLKPKADATAKLDLKLPPRSASASIAVLRSDKRNTYR